MATTKKSGAGRPKITSSHARQPAPRKAVGAKKSARPTAARPATRERLPRSDGPERERRPTKTGAKPKAKPRRADKPSRIAARSTATATATQRPRRPSMEVRTEAAEESKALALVIAKAALDKKAVNIEIVDVVGRVDYTDFLVLMSGRSDRHVLSVADGIEEELTKQIPKRKPTAVEGRPQGLWVVLDYGDVVAHVFQEDARSFYDLDSLWQDARKVPVSDRAPVV